MKNRNIAKSVKTLGTGIELHVTKEKKYLLTAAAGYEQMDLASFILRNALFEARKIIGRAEGHVLSEGDTALVPRLLENLPKPTPTLRAAAPVAVFPMANWTQNSAKGFFQKEVVIFPHLQLQKLVGLCFCRLDVLIQFWDL